MGNYWYTESGVKPMARPQRLPKNSINTASVSSVRISQEFYDERLQKVNDKINATAMQTLDCI